MAMHIFITTNSSLSTYGSGYQSECTIYGDIYIVDLRQVAIMIYQFM